MTATLRAETVTEATEKTTPRGIPDEVRAQAFGASGRHRRIDIL
jgi:hypothetical protein